jgi:hypothetical protein
MLQHHFHLNHHNSITQQQLIQHQTPCNANNHQLHHHHQNQLYILKIITVIPKLDFNSLTFTEIFLDCTSTTIREQTKWAMLVCILDAGYEKADNVKYKKEIVKNISTYHLYMGS